MASLNKVFLIGNLTKDPEVRYTPSGTAVCDLRMAVNRRYKGQDGEFHEDTCFVNVTAWGRQAETTGEYLRKGSSALVEGRLKFDEWEREGQKHSRLSVVAERIQFMGGKESQSGGGDGPRVSHAPEHVDPAPSAPSAPSAGDVRDDELQDDDNLPF